MIYDNHFNTTNGALSKKRNIFSMTGPLIYRGYSMPLTTEFSKIVNLSTNQDTVVDWRVGANIKQTKSKEFEDVKNDMHKNKNMRSNSISL